MGSANRKLKLCKDMPNATSTSIIETEDTTSNYIGSSSMVFQHGRSDSSDFETLKVVNIYIIEAA